MHFLRIAQIELSRPPADPWNLRTAIDGVSLLIQPRTPREAPTRRHLIFAEVQLESRPDIADDGLIVIPDEVVRQSENAIERFADLAAVATFSRRAITSVVPAAGFTGVTTMDRQWLDRSAGLSQPAQRINVVPAPIAITDGTLRALDDRTDGVELLTEALANTHETGRFRELCRFLERAFRAQPAALVEPLADFLGYYDRLQYARSEVEHWHQLRNQATHADRPQRRYVLARDVRPVLMRVELAAYDVLFNKLDWNQPSSERRDVWPPPGGVLPDEQTAVLRVGASMQFEADPMFDGFGAYPYDRTCKIGPYPPDWWLDATIRAKGKSGITTVDSLRSDTNEQA